MKTKYNLGYQLISKNYNQERYIILKKFDNVGSYLYKVKNEVEATSLSQVLELVCSDNLQVVLTNSPETYGEYKPYQEITDLKELIGLAMNN